MKMLQVGSYEDLSTVREVEVEDGPLVDGYYRKTNKGLLHVAYLIPLAAAADLKALITRRAALKKAYEDSMGDVMEFRNKVSRGEYDN